MIDALNALAQRATYDPEAKAALITQLNPLINGAVYRASLHTRLIDREDIRQQTLYYLLYLIARYDITKGHALLYFSLRLKQKVIQYVRREVKFSLEPFPLSEVRDIPPARPDAIDLGWEHSTQRALNSLSQGQRIVIDLAYVHDLSDPQIARLIGKDIPAVRQQRYRALRKMRKLL